MKKLFVFFTAGCIGAAASGLVAWFLGDTGITGAVGVAIAPQLTPPWIYRETVLGGLWGLIFILPLFNSRIILKGTLLSLIPSLVEMLLIYPDQGQGFAAMNLGTLAPLFILLFNWIWGVTAAAAIKAAR
ncbi:MAG: hypothetical protein ACOC0W_07375 [Desulfosalsimonas sp.]